jgi:hypothetical protein
MKASKPNLPLRKRLWCDFGQPPDTPPTKRVPVFRFSESRGVASRHGFYDPDVDPARPTDADLVRWIRELINDPELGYVGVNDFIGHEYIEMEWKDLKYYWRAMEAFLRHGITVFTQCRLCENLSAKDFAALNLAPHEPLTRELAEKLMVKNLRDINQGMMPYQQRPFQLGVFDYIPLQHPNAWLTEEGRRLVADVRRAKMKRNVEEASSSDEDIYALPTDPWPPISPRKHQREEEEEANVEEPPAKKPRVEVVILEDDDDDDDAIVDCMVCEERKADTLVLPCEHQVVCRACSEKLRAQDGFNATHCIVCRRVIDMVVKDGDK